MGGGTGGWEVRKVQNTQAGACGLGRLAHYHCHQIPNKDSFGRNGLLGLTVLCAVHHGGEHGGRSVRQLPLWSRSREQ